MKLYNYFIVFSLIGFLSLACSTKKEGGGEGDAATSAAKDEALRSYNLDIEKEQTRNRFACDTISLKEYILKNYEPGTYLVEFDRTFTYNVPKPAVIYFRDTSNYVLSVIAKSKPGERNIESKNVVGYESSYINLDSTKLGTAFFWLTLFECNDGEFRRMWESEVPIHGGFNRMTIKNWSAKKQKYVELNFEDGIISGHRNYNFFMTDGWKKPPHLMETYLALAHKRVLANVNNDKYPDYYEFRFATGRGTLDSLSAIRVLDSIPFYWSVKRRLYITDKSSRWFRKY
ncbi:MAG: hypothetical protein CVV24_05765 [Ignavibacteriae bacterium HGW-Ignavibacteriae-3]|nr:MAG: hypothetical protein CVV24_05765 [Ignavibacteriae bacterium HGW-Ignavibacteriae-3]